ncbi:MAG: protein-disulfide reductase DsbD domain-containing protein [Paracoccaceae bacterium]
MLKKRIQNILAVLALAVLPVTVWAQNTVSIDDVAQIEILPGWQTEDGRHMAAIHIQLLPGWKTYWRAPGESGIPPRFDWSGSRNLQSVRFMWPTPEVFYLNGTRTIGYQGDVVIPMELTRNNPGKGSIKLRGEMELGVCKDVCIPVSASFKADLGMATTPDPTIRASLRNRPATAKEAGVGRVTCKIEPISDGLRLTAQIEIARMGAKEVAVVELSDQTIWISQATSERKGRYLVAVAEMVPPSGTPFLLNRSDVRFTIFGDRGAVDIRGCTAG